MRTAVDSNVISALWSGEPGAADVSASLNAARQQGSLSICAPVYAELLAYPKATERFVHKFLEETEIVVDFAFDETIWREAGRRFARYVNRRRGSGGGAAKRLLVDFLVGSHALLKADALLTLDRDRYKKDFPELRLNQIHSL